MQTKRWIPLLLYLATLTQASATYISVRLIKAKPESCSTTPKLFFLNSPSAYRITEKQWYNGENKWEIFFEIETNDKNIPTESMQIEAEGVTIQRAIVGRTDVAFTKLGNRYQFTLVKDTTDGRHVQTPYQNPQGGPFVWIYHNWADRVNGKYKDIPYPEKALAASLNYTIACQEMLRLMGNMSGTNQTFNGEFILLNCESSAPRAHLDFPPHWHLQHWQHGYNKEYGLNWREKQYIIPHYYVDSLGNITSNKQSITQCYKPVKQTKSEYFFLDTCVWKDVENNLIFKQVITSDGLQFIKSSNEIWTLQPDAKGGHEGILIYKNKQQVAKIVVTDDAEKGNTTIFIEYMINQRKKSSFSNVIRYDPFTGINL